MNLVYTWLVKVYLEMLATYIGVEFVSARNGTKLFSFI